MLVLDTIMLTTVSEVKKSNCNRKFHRLVKSTASYIDFSLESCLQATCSNHFGSHTEMKGLWTPLAIIVPFAVEFRGPDADSLGSLKTNMHDTTLLRIVNTILYSSDEWKKVYSANMQWSTLVFSYWHAKVNGWMKWPWLCLLNWWDRSVTACVCPVIIW